MNTSFPDNFPYLKDLREGERALANSGDPLKLGVSSG